MVADIAHISNVRDLEPPADRECLVCSFEIGTSSVISKRLRALLSPDEIERADRFIRPEHQTNFANVRGMLRMVLGTVLESSPELIEFEYGEHGKPKLVDARLEFNLSHSAGWAVIALAQACAVGVDIEGPRESSDLDKLAKRYFAPSEVTAIGNLPEDDRRRAFYRCWSSKEALMKVTGRGLSLGLDKFAVEVNPNSPPGLRVPPEDFPESLEYSWDEVSVASELYAVVVAAAPNCSFTAIQLDSRDV